MLVSEEKKNKVRKNPVASGRRKDSGRKKFPFLNKRSPLLEEKQEVGSNTRRDDEA